MPVTAPLVIGAAATIGKSIFGSYQANQAAKQQRKLEGQFDALRKTRPEYNIPTEQLQYLAMEQQRMGTQLPGLDKMKDNLASETAAGVGNIQESSNSISGTLGALTQLYGQQMKGVSALDIQNAQFMEGRKDSFEQALKSMADYKDKQWAWNKQAKYGEDYNYLQSKIAGANADKNQGTQNMFSGFSDFSNLLGNYGLANAMKPATETNPYKDLTNPATNNTNFPYK
jgi:hypothetical protein